jgi:hypothetical protein
MLLSIGRFIIMPKSSRLSIDDLAPLDLINLDNIDSTQIVGGSGRTGIFYDAPVVPKYIIDPKRPNVAILDIADWQDQLRHPRYPIPAHPDYSLY